MFWDEGGGRVCRDLEASPRSYNPNSFKKTLEFEARANASLSQMLVIEVIKPPANPMPAEIPT